MEYIAGTLIPKPTIVVAALEATVHVIRSLGECYWTMRVDNSFGQPGADLAGVKG